MNSLPEFEKNDEDILKEEIKVKTLERIVIKVIAKKKKMRKTYFSLNDMRYMKINASIFMYYL